jgi:hypothetical protein
MSDDLQNLDKYSKTRQPALYNDFIEFSKPIITNCQKAMLRKLINFNFRKHSRYNLPKERLAAIEKNIQSRVRDLLK